MNGFDYPNYGVDELLPAMLDLKKAGKIRYIGITTSQDGQYPELTAAMKKHPFDFVQVDLSQWSPAQPVDFIFSNAALHWIDDHAALLTRLAGWLAPRGTLAVL